MNLDELIEKGKKFASDIENKKTVEKALASHKEFLKLFPFRERPETIDALKPEDIYNPGKGNYFFTWIEHKLKPLGHLRIGSALYCENARDQLPEFKELLKKAMNDSLPVSEKVDEAWGNIKMFGGDKTIAKKIIACYYLDELLPIFKTEDLEHLVSSINVDYEKRALEKYGKRYFDLSIGQKFELLNKILLEFKQSTDLFKNWNNVLFTRFLYRAFPITRTQSIQRTTESLTPYGLISEPTYEQEIVFLFSRFHKELGFPYIIKIQESFPDAEVMTKRKETKKIEFEVRASDFIAHGHLKEMKEKGKLCDYIVCWENDLDDTQSKNLPEIISLKDSIKEFL